MTPKRKLIDVINGDPVLALVQTHLQLEYVVIEYIRHGLRNPAQFPIDRLSFPLKVDLAIALGDFPENARKAVLKVNALRNRLAHKLDADITAKDVQELLGETSYLQPVHDVVTQDQPPSASAAFIASSLQAYLWGALYAKKTSGAKEMPSHVLEKLGL
jgi:hypothetical protein